MTVYCRFNATHSTTIINHDTEDRLYVRSSMDGPGSFVRTITYQSSFDMIVALIDHSDHCRQLLSYECSGSGFHFNTSQPSSWWSSRSMAREYSRGPNCSSVKPCQCDSAQRFNWACDFGYVKNRAKLPIRQVAFGEVNRIGQLGYVRVGELECTGNVAPNICEDQQQAQLNKNNAVQPKQFQCHSGQIIDATSICIYEFDQLGYQIGCRDVSHLRNCSQHQCAPDYVKCPNSYCIPHRYMCNGKWDCIAGKFSLFC